MHRRPDTRPRAARVYGFVAPGLPLKVGALRPFSNWADSYTAMSTEQQLCTRMRELRGADAAIPDEPTRRVQVPALCRRRRAELRAGACQPYRAVPGAPAGSARDRSRRCVAGTAARAGRRHPHDTDSRQARAVPGPKNRRHSQPAAARDAGFGAGKLRCRNLGNSPRPAMRVRARCRGCTVRSRCSQDGSSARLALRAPCARAQAATALPSCS